MTESNTQQDALSFTNWCGDPEAALEGLLSHFSAAGLTLYPAQEEAILALFSEQHVVLETPTGSGKSLVATAAQLLALVSGKRCVYTAPIKALVNEKFFDACGRFGAESVGLVTGDTSVNPDAPLVCCTAEVLANWCARPQRVADIGWVIMDEFHYYADKERGRAWQLPLLVMDQARFVLLSATLGDMRAINEDLQRRTRAEVAHVHGSERPVPLDFSYSESPLTEVLQSLQIEQKLPAYVVYSSQRAATEAAQGLVSLDLLTREEKLRMREALRGADFSTPLGPALKRYLEHGVGVHHAGLLPRYRRLVESLAQTGLLRVVTGTDTLGVGINLPLRSVVLTGLARFDGQKMRLLSARAFHQLVGRAGRRGYDTMGHVLVQAPEHVIENRQTQRKLADNPKKLRKISLKKPPEQGYVHWDEAVYERLQTAAPEALVPRFSVDYGLVIRWLEGHEGRLRSLRTLIESAHVDAYRKRQLKRHAIKLIRSLVSADVLARSVEANGEVRYRVNEELQTDFALDQALGTYALAVIESLDADSPDYALDVVSVLEATLETPAVILRQQLNKLRRETLAHLKAEGVEFEERNALLDELDVSRPLADMLEAQLAAFRVHTPWLDARGLEAKSIGRELLEDGVSFNAYIKRYGLERAEGVLLRYLHDLSRRLQRSVPDAWKTDALLMYEDALLTLVERVDASLSEGWEALAKLSAKAPVAAPAVDASLDRKRQEIRVENALMRALAAWSREDWESLSKELEVDSLPSEAWLQESSRDFVATHDALRLDLDARARRHVEHLRDATGWRARRRLCDLKDFNDWELEVEVVAHAEGLVLRWVSLQAVA